MRNNEYCCSDGASQYAKTEADESDENEGLKSGLDPGVNKIRFNNKSNQWILRHNTEKNESKKPG